MLSDAWKWLISRPQPQIRPTQVIAWWEIRRIPYNLIVGAVGAVSLVLFFVFITISGHLEPGEDAVEPLALFVAPFAVNLCYTAGWIVELLLMAIRKHHATTGPRLFVLGIVFSLAVLLFPSAYWTMVWLLQLVGVAH